MTYANKTAALLAELSASEKGYLKKFFKTRIAVLSSKKAAELDQLFSQVETGLVAQAAQLSEAVQKEVFDLVLFGLEEYHKTDSTRARSYINQVEILLEKNLNGQGEKLLAKAKKLAKKEGNDELLCEIIEWQIAIHSLKPPTEKNMKLFDEYFGELNALIEKQQKIEVEA